MSDLVSALERLDGRPYGAYRDLGGRGWSVGPYGLAIEHVQGDPFAAPSRVRVDVPPGVVDLPARAVSGADQRRATADFLHRALVRGLAGGRRAGGSGRSGVLEIVRPGAEILDRTAVRIAADGTVTVRIAVGLPADGRRILGRAASSLLARALPAALDAAIAGPALDRPALDRHVDAVLDQAALRGGLAARGLVAFLAAGSVLPRRSGVDDAPLPDAVPLAVPDALAVTLETPHTGPVRGLGIRAGVTLIVGGGYHGKSTLLDALARGVYDHPPGDGRERCVTDGAAVLIRAEDGRSVRGVDLRPFIGDLPLGRRTDRFDTDDASGSTSQAAAIVEALAAGARVLLVDEDTAATNFMIRDARMRRLVPPGAEPITPFLDRVRQLHAERDVSSVLVVGGAGDYLDVADTVIRMQDYRPHDASAEARIVAAALPLGEAAPRAPGPWPTPAPRVPDPASLDPRRGGRREHVRATRTQPIAFGDDEIAVSLLAQLGAAGQCRFVGDALRALAHGVADGRRDVAALVDALEAQIANDGLDAVAAPTFGDRTQARRFEIAAALNRLRSLRVR